MIRTRTPAFWQPQRRKLVSTSRAAATGMHTARDVSTTIEAITLSFWLKRTSSTSTDTFWASDVGGYQVYNGSANVRLVARVPTNASLNFPAYSIGDWHFFVIHAGTDISSGNELKIRFDNGAPSERTGSVVSSELSTLGTHWLLGDDSVTANTDAGWVGEAFDICTFDGIVDPFQLQFINGRWRDLPEYAKSKLLYRIDGQGPGAGWDSSERGNHFVVENGGVTLSLDNLPPGANEWIMREIPYVPAVVAGGIDFLADKGTYTLAGQTASISVNRLVSMDAGAYTLAGQDLSILQTVAVPMDLGTFAHTGQSAGITRQLQFSADLGTYTFSGQSAEITRQIPIVADLGTYTLDGQIVTVLRQIPVVADLGTYALAGQSAELTRNLIISADLGTYTFSGKDLSILEASAVPMDTGTFALAGQSATILRQLNIVANLGTFTLTGQSANISILAGPLSSDRISAMHFQRHYEPTAMGA